LDILWGTFQMKKFNRLGIIGRWKPLHHGGAVLLEALCEKSEQVVIGIGSTNKYNARNPWTAEESKAMIESYLSPKFSNYEVLSIPDFAHDPEYRDGQKWRQHVIEKFGKLDAFVSGNDYVKELLKDDYKIINSWELVPEDKHLPVKGSMVRLEMARGDAWKKMVPQSVIDYLERNGLVDRFRREFGLETLAGVLEDDYFKHESKKKEQLHTYEK
jgi:nicotinamide-nucleotide adenylyltransferase